MYRWGIDCTCGIYRGEDWQNRCRIKMMSRVVSRTVTTQLKLEKIWSYDVITNVMLELKARADESRASDKFKVKEKTIDYMGHVLSISYTQSELNKIKSTDMWHTWKFDHSGNESSLTGHFFIKKNWKNKLILYTTIDSLPVRSEIRCLAME